MQPLRLVAGIDVFTARESYGRDQPPNLLLIQLRVPEHLAHGYVISACLKL